MQTGLLKIFGRKHLPAIALIVILCCVASGVVADRLPRGGTYIGKVTKCDGFAVLFNANAQRCTTSPARMQDYGLPFRAITVANPGTNGEQTFRRDSTAYVGQGGNDAFYISLNTVFLWIVSITGYVLYRRHRSKHAPVTPHNYDEPVISPSDLLGETAPKGVHKGKIAGYDYNLLTNSTGRVMLMVILPKPSNIHFVAVGAKSQSSLPLAERIESRFLEPIVLEGTFPKDFQLYCTPGRQTDIRQIFEPVTMAYVMDFCRSYQIEVFRDTFYVAQAATDAKDNTTMVEDTEKLLKYHGDLLERLSNS